MRMGILSMAGSTPALTVRRFIDFCGETIRGMGMDLPVCADAAQQEKGNA
jgi:hypothetical protein